MKEIEIDGYLYWIGESAEDNWAILGKANQAWWWFHLDKFSSCYVILCNSLKKDKLKRKMMKIGAQLVKANTKYKNIPKIQVLFAQCKNVKKGNVVGEAICKKYKKMTV